MNRITKIDKLAPAELVIVITNGTDYPESLFSKPELDYFSEMLGEKGDKALLISLDRKLVVYRSESEGCQDLEKLRRKGSEIKIIAQQIKSTTVQIVGTSLHQVKAAAEGLALANYTFEKYLTEKSEDSVEQILVLHPDLTETEVDQLNILVEAVYTARDLVNEPVITLNTEALAQKALDLAEDCGAKAELFSEAKIESLKMGGLLGVNRGSIDPPAFVVLEWKPENAVNSKPIALVGKGVVFDTGGNNLKTGSYMTDMKMDMGGAAIVLNAFWAVAKTKTPLHLLCFLPITDNRIGGNALVPGDVITMYNGKTVEVLNTDAEGRLILADALSYADKYKPELIIDAATLTGAAERAIGKYAIVGMGNAPRHIMEQLADAADSTGERLVEMPFWDDYAELIKSDIADFKNIGGANGGAIVAGKFLEKFTNSPYIHLDIAGVSYTSKASGYHTVGGTGVGIRTIFDFFNHYSL